MRTSINAPTVMNEDEDEISALRPFWPSEEDVDELQLMVARLRMEKQALLQSKRASAFRGDRREPRPDQTPAQAQTAELRRQRRHAHTCSPSWRSAASAGRTSSTDWGWR